MSFTSWLRNIRSALVPSRVDNKHRQRSRRDASHRPQLEVLEDRCLLSFSPAVSYPAGGYPQAVVAADFNNDTILDLAIGNYNSTVSVLLGNADGTFQPALTFATGANPQSLAVGDFNADGKLDLAAVNSDSYYSEQYVSLLLGNGDGTFQAPTNIGIGSDPQSVAVGDFNGDGNMDLGVTSNIYFNYGGYYGGGHYEGRANVLLGNGDGSFSETPNTTGLGYGYQTSSAVAANLNGDGFDDFVTVNDDYGADYGYVKVLLGNGSGYLQGASSFYTGYYSHSLAAGDVNGDGNIDVVTANGYNNNISVLLGDGAGGFGAAGNYAASGSPASVVLGDFTGDGKVDLATANYYSNDLSVLYGIGDGTFSTPVNSAAGSYPVGVATGDFNGDGWLDAATANFEGTLSVLINDHLWPSESAPYVTINDVTVTEGNTGTLNATFTLTLSGASDQAITVHYQTVDGSATAGSDYAGASGDVTFAAGETSQTISISVFGDRRAEPTESFAVNLRSSDAFIGDGLGVATILDDEPSVSINDVTVTEGNSGTVSAIFTVNLSAACDAAVTVQYASANQTALAGSDYQAANGAVTFAPGETTRTITVLVNGDTLGELDETFAVNLSSVDAHVVDGQGTGTIVGDEPAYIWLNPWDAALGEDYGDGSRASAGFSGAGAPGDAGAASATASAFAQAWGSTLMWDSSSYASASVYFQRTFVLTGSPTGWNVSLDALLSGTLFASGYSAFSNVSAQVRIIRDTTGAVTHEINFLYGCMGNGGFRTLNISAPGNRTVVIPDGTYTVTGALRTYATGYLVEYTGSNQSYSSFSPGLDTTIDAVVWDNPPDISISDATFVEGNNGAVTGYFTVALSNPWDQNVTVNFALADGSATQADHDYGYLDATRTVTFAPGVMQQTIAVQIYGDRKFEPNETFSVNLSSPINATIADGQGQGTILDEEPSVSINDVTVTEGNTGTRSAAFTVRLSVAYDVPVTIGYATANGTAAAGSDYQAASGTLTIPAGQTSGTITVLVSGDRLGEPNESFFVNLNSLNYGVITDGQGVGTIVDDEPRISITDVTKVEGNSGTTLFVFTVSLSFADEEAVTVNYVTADGKAKVSDNDYLANSGTLTFAPGETTKTITIEVKGDRRKEPKEMFYLDLFGSSSNSLISKNRGIGTIQDDD